MEKLHRFDLKLAKVDLCSGCNSLTNEKIAQTTARICPQRGKNCTEYCQGLQISGKIEQAGNTEQARYRIPIQPKFLSIARRCTIIFPNLYQLHRHVLALFFIEYDTPFHLLSTGSKCNAEQAVRTLVLVPLLGMMAVGPSA